MERPRNEITGDHLITETSQCYPAGFKIFAPKTKYISGRFDSNRDLAFFNKVSDKHTVLIGSSFFSTHKETKSSDAAREQQMLTDVSPMKFAEPRSRGEVTAVLVKLRKHV